MVTVVLAQNGMMITALTLLIKRLHADILRFVLLLMTTETSITHLWEKTISGPFPCHQWSLLCHVISRSLIVPLTHWGRVTHIGVSKLTNIGSDNGLSPARCQAIIWTNIGILLIGLLETNFSEILIEIHTFPFKKMDLKMPFGNWWPFCFGLNVLTQLLN